jgi:hypothetical protein
VWADHMGPGGRLRLVHHLHLHELVTWLLIHVFEGARAEGERGSPSLSPHLSQPAASRRIRWGLARESGGHGVSFPILTTTVASGLVKVRMCACTCMHVNLHSSFSAAMYMHVHTQT